MASNRVLAKSINMPFLQSNNKFIYVSLLVVLSFLLNFGCACPHSNAKANPKNNANGGVTHAE